MIIVLDGNNEMKLTKAAMALGNYIKATTGMRFEPTVRVTDDVTNWLDWVDLLKQDCKKKSIVIWTRSWVTNQVFNQASPNEWMYEWMINRGVLGTGGFSIMILDDNDDSHEKYHQYALRNNWYSTVEAHSGYYAGLASQAVYRHMAPFLYNDNLLQTYSIPDYAGILTASVLVIGESINSFSAFPGSFLPFTSSFTMEFGKQFGVDALKMGWTNADVCKLAWVETAEFVITCGNHAREWYEDVIERRLIQNHIHLKHPAWTYRFNNDATVEEKRRIAMTAAFVKNLYRRLEAGYAYE
jgi:hypothetical protein